MVGDFRPSDTETNKSGDGLKAKDCDFPKGQSATADGEVAVSAAAIGTPASNGIPIVVAATSSDQRS